MSSCCKATSPRPWGRLGLCLAVPIQHGSHKGAVVTSRFSEQSSLATLGAKASSQSTSQLSLQKQCLKAGPFLPVAGTPEGPLWAPDCASAHCGEGIWGPNSAAVRGLCPAPDTAVPAGWERAAHLLRAAAGWRAGLASPGETPGLSAVRWQPRRQRGVSCSAQSRGTATTNQACSGRAVMSF